MRNLSSQTIFLYRWYFSSFIRRLLINKNNKKSTQQLLNISVLSSMSFHFFTLFFAFDVKKSICKEVTDFMLLMRIKFYGMDGPQKCPNDNEFICKGKSGGKLLCRNSSKMMRKKKSICHNEKRHFFSDIK